MKVKIYQATWSETLPPYRVKSTEITGIKEGTFHYHASMAEGNNYRGAGVFASYIEFDYFSDNGIVLNNGDSILFAKVVNGGYDFAPDTYEREIQVRYFNVFSVTKKSKTYHIVAYDDTIFLDVDFSATLKANEANFPMSMLDLLNLAANTAGVTIPFNSSWVGSVDAFGNPKHNWIDTTVKYFYADGITVRSIIRWAAELSNSVLLVPANYLNLTKTISLHTFASVGKAAGYDYSNRYIVAPGDGTYSHPRIPAGVTPNVVWYKENGLEIKNGFSAFDGVEIISSNGKMLASYYGSQVVNSVFQISGNLLADNIISFDAGFSFDGVAEEIFSSINYLSGSNDNKVGAVHIFPFRNPYENGLNLYGVDDEGNYFVFPIMSVDLNDSDCVINSYNYSETDNIYEKKSVDQKESLSAAWSSINQLESKVDNIGIQIDEILNEKSIPTTATSYDCDWGHYDALVICAMFYSNVMATIFIPTSYFRATTTTLRPIVYDPVNSRRFDVYKDDNDSVYLVGFSTPGAAYGVRIYGVSSRKDIASVEYLVTADGDYLTTVDGDYLTL